MNMKKKKYISPWIQTVPLDMAEDIMLRISSEAVPVSPYHGNEPCEAGIAGNPAGVW